ncbi:uncharacterized protein LOC117786919 [Drosophila innubila]|uniref:uncharacterized protein LOC117786919 n=1 Tax=Drosophila innubila TaxID=198719 RepID=UPI00148E1F34|nr:uncharacterized protein LOC117786919 [Drosophila innubila]
MSTNFGSKDGILIRTMKMEDYYHVKIFMREHFYTADPIFAVAGEDASKRMQQFYEESSDHISMIKEGTSLLAIDEDDGERIVGIVLAGSLFASSPEEIRRRVIEMEHCSLKPIFMFMTDVLLKANVFEKYGVIKLLYSSKTTVETSMRGKGLGTRLAAALMEVGRSRDFP